MFFGWLVRIFVQSLSNRIVIQIYVSLRLFYCFLNIHGLPLKQLRVEFHLIIIGLYGRIRPRPFFSTDKKSFKYFRSLHLPNQSFCDWFFYSNSSVKIKEDILQFTYFELLYLVISNEKLNVLRLF